MDFRQLVHLGRLSEAVENLTEQIRGNPSETQLRLSLFELLCFQGELERAAKQLDVISSLSSDINLMLLTEVYGSLLRSEGKRREVFQGGELPKFLSTPPAYIDKYLVMMRKMEDGSEELPKLLTEVEEMYPESRGELKGKPFSSFRDADDRLAPVLEACQGEDYLWIPLEQVVSLRLVGPKTEEDQDVFRLRDYMWAQGSVELLGGSSEQLFFPTLYPLSFEHPEDAVRMGRTTDFQIEQEAAVIGKGHKTFLVDDSEIALLELREVSFVRGDK
jgi:type VI secretion system protein ImpE